MKKIKLPLWLSGGIFLLLTSCLGDDAAIEEWNLSNCQISTFSLSSDSISDLANVKFTIDQVNGLIFNKDSMPYGTNILFKVICNVTYAVGGITSIEVHQKATDEKAYWNGTDSLDFSDDVEFYIISYDGKASKTYTAKLNVHQQHPDSMAWSRDASPLPVTGAADRKVIVHDNAYLLYARSAGGYELYESPLPNADRWTKASLTGLPDKTFILSQITEYEGHLYLLASDGALFRATDGRTWTAVDGAPAIAALLGAVNAGTGPEGRPSALAAIVRNGDARRFAAMNASTQWQEGTDVPDGFPVTGFASNSYRQMYYSHLSLVAGKDRNGTPGNKSWDTMDGLTWICLTVTGKDYFDRREGAMLADYDGKLYLIGGINASNQGLKDIYTSADKGVTWASADSLTFLPDTYRGRGYASMLVDKDNFVLLFGGKERNEANMSDELWRGRINRLGYKD